MKRIFPLVLLLINSALPAQPDKNGFQTHYHSNGQKSGVGFYDKGIKDGFWKYWNDSGKLEKTESYRKGQLHGWQKIYDDREHLVREAYFTDGQQDSSYKEYSSYGPVVVSGHYTKGVKAGRWDYYFPPAIPGNGSWKEGMPVPAPVLKKTEHYSAGQLNGACTEYDQWGRVMMSGSYAKGKKEGEFKKNYSTESEWYDGDSLVKVKKVTGGITEEYEVKNGQKHGMYKSWSYGNVPRLEGYYKNGIRHGKFTEYTSAGVKRLEYSYRNGILHGEKREYYPNGNPSLICRFSNGIFDSLYSTYHPNGVLDGEWRCVKGNFEGPYTAHHPNGLVSERGNYTNDMREGTFLVYDSLGNKTGAVMYSQGMMDGMYTAWNKNGVKLIEAKFAGDSLTPEVRYWSQQGQRLRTPLLGKMVSIESAGNYYYYGYAPQPDTLPEFTDQVNFISSLPLETYRAGSKPARYAKGEKALEDQLRQLIQPYLANYYYGRGIVVLALDFSAAGKLDSITVLKAYEKKSPYYNSYYGNSYQPFSTTVLQVLATLKNQNWVAAEENGRKVKSREILIIKGK